MTNLQKRVLSSIVLIPLVAAMVWIGGIPFQIFLVATLGLSLYELVTMSHLRARYEKALVLFGGVYIIASFFLMWHMRIMAVDGLSLVISFFVCLWCSDSAAYLFGKFFGGPKLAPKVSPNKTIAGMIGAVVGSIIPLIICDYIYHLYIEPDNWYWPTVILVGATVGIVAQGGDLLMSVLKRFVGVKDTSHLIPGHGGILDRIDSLLLALPFFYVLILLTF